MTGLQGSVSPRGSHEQYHSGRPTQRPDWHHQPACIRHFAEHLGRCCYEGIWVGTRERAIPQRAGFRVDVLDALRALPVPLLRWPGGCYADHYHWRDGIGPPENRPVRLGMSCGLQVEDDNSLGTHEFLWLCREIGAEPYLAGNVGSGTPQELADWLEYCNTNLDTALGRERRANGASDPFGVPLWGVGNENWGCGGNFDATGFTSASAQVLTARTPADANSADEPDRVVPNHLAVRADGRGTWRLELPPHSLTTVVLLSG
jgi:alpha-N-arabinofuranosidase